MEKDKSQQSGLQDPNNKKDQMREQPDDRNIDQKQQLKKEDLPESDNESNGSMGSGQRQDSN